MRRPDIATCGRPDAGPSPRSNLRRFSRSHEPFPRRRRTRPGFTLGELMVVLIGLAIVAAAVIPTLLGAGRRDHLDRVAARVAASARIARETARAHSVTVALTLESGPEAVRLQVEEEEGASADRTPQETGALLPASHAVVRLPEGVTARLEPSPDAAAEAASGGAPDALRFPAEGRPAGGVVVLSDRRGREQRVHVMPDTGIVRVEREEP